MKSIDFKERNCKIAFSQDEYQGIYAHKNLPEEYPGAIEYNMCFKLDEKELKQVQETGVIWLKRLQPVTHDFHPIGPDLLKPDEFESPKGISLEDAISRDIGEKGTAERDEFDSNVDKEVKALEFNPETFDIKTVDFSKVNYFFKKQAAIHLKLEFEGKSEAAHTEALLEAQKAAMADTGNPGF